MTIHWNAVEQFVFQFFLVCNFGNFFNFGLDTVRSERLQSKGGREERDNSHSLTIRSSTGLVFGSF